MWSSLLFSCEEILSQLTLRFFLCILRARKIERPSPSSYLHKFAFTFFSRVWACVCTSVYVVQPLSQASYHVEMGPHSRVSNVFFGGSLLSSSVVRRTVTKILFSIRNEWLPPLTCCCCHCQRGGWHIQNISPSHRLLPLPYYNNNSFHFRLTEPHVFGAIYGRLCGSIPPFCQIQWRACNAIWCCTSEVHRSGNRRTRVS